MSAVRAWLPIVQRILPLLDGNFGTAVSNILTPYPQHTAPPTPPVNLEPIEDSLADWSWSAKPQTAILWSSRNCWKT